MHTLYAKSRGVKSLASPHSLQKPLQTLHSANKRQVRLKDKKRARPTGSRPSEVTGSMQHLIDLVKDIIFIFVVFIVFTTVGFASYHIPSGSMEPTLEVGDRIVVSKFSYGYNRYSVLLNPDFIGEGRIFSDTPDRGDVAVFTLPHQDNKDLVKRVIGLPGDRIQVRNGRLLINGEMVKRTPVREFSYVSYRGEQLNVTEYDEELPGGVVHRIYEESDREIYDNTREYLVPADHYFMMGDNRDGSNDSRSVTMGMVHQKYLVGRARTTTFSLYDCDQGKDIYCPGGVPLGRFVTAID